VVVFVFVDVVVDVVVNVVMVVVAVVVVDVIMVVVVVMDVVVDVVVVFRCVKFKHMAHRVQLLWSLMWPFPPYHRVTGCLMSNAGI
jgi:hypothetical protein